MQIYRLFYKDSIESKIYNLLSHKSNLSLNFNEELLKIAKNLFLI
ncbi:MAG: hypothetical protein SOW25_05580 [Helicobacter sp.]|nr:hypothetical protein [Helicobacter sp.]